MSFTMIVVHVGVRMSTLTLSILLPSVKSITVRVVCLLHCGQYIVGCLPDFARFFNWINSSHGFVCGADPSSGLWLDAVLWKSAECQSIFRSLSLSVDDNDKRILWNSKILPEYTTSLPVTKQSSLCFPTESIWLIHTYHAVPRLCRVALIYTYRAVPMSCSYKCRVLRQSPRRRRKNSELLI
jgi:hypothetical protein